MLLPVLTDGIAFQSVYKEAEVPEAAAQAREPRGVAGRAGGGAATPRGAAGERSAEARLPAASRPSSEYASPGVFLRYPVGQTFHTFKLALLS